MKKLIIAVMLAAMAAMGCGGSSPTAPPTPAAAPPPPVPACQANNTGTYTLKNEYARLEPIDVRFNGSFIARALPWGHSVTREVAAGVKHESVTYRTSNGAFISVSYPILAACQTLTETQPATTGGD
jgi:hypothetical protein